MRSVSFALFVSMLATSAIGGPTLEVRPPAQNAGLGDSVAADLIISDLGQFALSAFRLDVFYDASILEFIEVTFGDPVLGDQLDLLGNGTTTSVDGSIPGSVNIFESSFAVPWWYLEDNQADDFTLATLSFDTVGFGTSPLDISASYLGDAFDMDLRWAVDVSGGAVSVVPVPGALLLGCIGSGLVCLLRRKLKSI